MPDFLTFSSIEELRKSMDLNETYSTRIFKAASVYEENKNIFLSYSSKDEKHLPIIIKILETHGGSVFIDKGDTRLPINPSKETAEILRNTIKNLRRFVLFVSTNTKDSKWVPWELGLGDAYKSSSSVALFPIAEFAEEQEWAEQQYLGLYKRIAWGWIKGENEKCWMVYDHTNNTAEKLRSWIRLY